MTEQELDLFMRNVLLDAIALDEETNTETIPYTPSLHHQKQIKAMLSVVTTSYASIDETRAHIEGQIWLPDLRQRDVENYCAGFVYTDESKTTLDHISARYELSGWLCIAFPCRLRPYDRLDYRR